MNEEYINNIYDSFTKEHNIDLGDRDKFKKTLSVNPKYRDAIFKKMESLAGQEFNREKFDSLTTYNPTVEEKYKEKPDVVKKPIETKDKEDGDELSLRQELSTKEKEQRIEEIKETEKLVKETPAYMPTETAEELEEQEVEEALSFMEEKEIFGELPEESREEEVVPITSFVKSKEDEELKFLTGAQDVRKDVTDIPLAKEELVGKEERIAEAIKEKEKVAAIEREKMDKKFDEFSKEYKEATDKDIFLRDIDKDLVAKGEKIIIPKGIVTPDDVKEEGLFTAQYNDEGDENRVFGKRDKGVVTSSGYVLGSAYNQSVFGMLHNLMIGEAPVDISNYKASEIEDGVAFVLSMIPDAVVMASTGGVGTLTFRGLGAGTRALTKQLVKKGVKKEIATQITRTGRDKLLKTYLKKGIQSSFGLSGWSMIRNIGEDMTSVEGDKRKYFDDVDWNSVKKHGLIDGTLGFGLGILGTYSSALERSLINNSKSKIQQLGTKTGVKASAFGAENIVFLYGGAALDPERRISEITANDWLHSMSTLLGIKISGAIQGSTGKFVKNKLWNKDRVNKGIFEIELSKDELNAINKGKTTQEVIGNLKNNGEAIKETFDNPNITEITKEKLAWSLTGIRPTTPRIDINEVNLYTKEGKSVLELKDSKGNLLEKKTYEDNIQAEKDASFIAEEIKDVQNREKVADMTVKEKIEVEDRLIDKNFDFKTFEEANSTLPGLRTREQKKVINEFVKHVDEVISKRPKEEIKEPITEEPVKEEIIEKEPIKEEVEKPYFEDEANIPIVAEKISKGEKLTEQDLQLQKNFPEKIENELQIKKEVKDAEEIREQVEKTSDEVKPTEEIKKEERREAERGDEQVRLRDDEKIKTSVKKEPDMALESLEGRARELYGKIQESEGRKSVDVRGVDPYSFVIDNWMSITPESAKKETGADIGAKKDISTSMLKRKDKGGESVERVAEEIQEMYKDVVGEDVVLGIDFKSHIIDVLMEGSIKKAKEKYIEDPNISEYKRELKDIEGEIKKITTKYEAKQKDEKLRDFIKEKEQDLKKIGSGKIPHIIRNIKGKSNKMVFNFLNNLVERNLSVRKIKEMEKGYDEIDKITNPKSFEKKTKGIREAKYKAEAYSKATDKLIYYRKKFFDSTKEDYIRAQEEIENIWGETENRYLTDKELARLEELEMTGGYYMSNQEINNVVNKLKEINKEGMSKARKQIITQRAETNRITEDVIESINRGKDIEATAETKAEAKTKADIFDFVRNQNFFSFLERIDKVKSEKPYDNPLNRILGREVHKADNEATSGVREMYKIITDKQKEIFGKNVEDIIIKNRTEKKDAVEYKSELRDKIKTISLNQNLAYKKWMEMQDPTLDRRMERMGLKRFVIDERYKKRKVKGQQKEMLKGHYELTNKGKAIENYLTPEVKKYAEWQINELYPILRERYNPSYKKMFGLDMPLNEKYSPAYTAKETGDMSVGEMMMNNPSFNTANNSHLYKRTKNLHELEYIDGDMTLLSYIQRMEHFKAKGEIVKKLNTIFNDKRVRQALRKNFPKGRGKRFAYLEVVDDFLKDYSRVGVPPEKITKQVDVLRGSFIKASLGVRPTVFAKQQLSIPAYGNFLPLGQLSVGLGKFWKNPIDNSKFLLENSDFLKNRMKIGFDRDLIASMNKIYKNRAHKGYDKLMEKLMLNVKYGDISAILQGGHAIYDYNYNKFLKEGFNKTEAKAKAVEEMEWATRHSQQASDVADLSYWQRHNSWAKALTMYQTSPSSYHRIAMGGAKTFLEGVKTGNKKLIASGAKRFFIAHVVLPSIFQYVSNGFVWDDEDQIASAVFGNAQSLFAVGNAVQTLYNLTTGANFEAEISPLSGLVKTIKPTTKDIINLFEKEKENIQPEDVWDVTNEVASTSSYFLGVPYDGIENIVSGVSDVIKDEADYPLRRILGFSEWKLKDKEESMKTHKKVRKEKKKDDSRKKKNKRGKKKKN